MLRQSCILVHRTKVTWIVFSGTTVHSCKVRYSVSLDNCWTSGITVLWYSCGRNELVYDLSLMPKGRAFWYCVPAVWCHSFLYNWQFCVLWHYWAWWVYFHKNHTFFSIFHIRAATPPIKTWRPGQFPYKLQFFVRFPGSENQATQSASNLKCKQLSFKMAYFSKINTEISCRTHRLHMSNYIAIFSIFLPKFGINSSLKSKVKLLTKKCVPSSCKPFLSILYRMTPPVVEVPVVEVTMFSARRNFPSSPAFFALCCCVEWISVPR